MPPPPAVQGKSPAGKIILAAVVVLVIAAGGWFGYKKFVAKQPQVTAAAPTAAPVASDLDAHTGSVPLGQSASATDWTLGGNSGAAPAQRAPTSRPSASHPAVATQAVPLTQQATPTQSITVAATQAPPVTPRSSSGVIVWTGSLDKHSVVTIDGGSASSGRVQGILPGIPVSIEVEPSGVGVAEAPSPNNGWKRIVLRCRKGNFSQVTIRWHVL